MNKVVNAAKRDDNRLLYCELWSYSKLQNIVYFAKLPSKENVWEAPYLVLFSSEYELFT